MPESIAIMLAQAGVKTGRIGLEAFPLSDWIYHGLVEAQTFRCLRGD